MLKNRGQHEGPLGPKPDSNSNNGDTSGEVDRWVELQKERAHVSKLVDQLNKTISDLPEVNEKSVIWPEMEERYAMKGEIEKELASGIEKLKGYIPLLETEVQRCLENLRRIEGDSAKLNRQEPRESYSEAQEAAKKQCFSAVGHRDATAAVLAQAQTVLDVSRKKKFPGDPPQRQSPLPEKNPDFSQSSVPRSRPEKLDDETTDLISLGPLGQGQK